MLDHLFEVEVIFKIRPALGKGSSAVIVGSVCGSIPILVFDKIEVPPHVEVGNDRDSCQELCELLGASSEADRAQINVEGDKAVRAVLCIEGDAKGVSFQAIREGELPVVIEGSH